MNKKNSCDISLNKNGNIKTILPEDVDKMIAEGYVLIDVREPEEWKEGIIPGAQTISLGSILDNLDKFDPEKKYIMNCRSGGRSYKACELLVENNIENVHNLTGGYSGYINNKK